MKSAGLILRKPDRWLHAIVAAAVLIAASSCSTLPSGYPEDSNITLLPADSNVLVSVNAEAGTELVEPVLEAVGGSIPEDLSVQLMTRTRRIWAGVSLGGPVPVSSVVIEGDFPRFPLNWGLCWDPSWVKNSAGDGSYSAEYYQQKDGRQQIAVPADDFLMASSGRIGEMLGALYSGAPAARTDWLEAERNADIVVSVRGLSQEQYGSFIPEFKRLPLESLVFTMTKDGLFYNLGGRFSMAGAADAFLFSTLFRALVVAARDGDGNRLFRDLKSIEINRDGNDVTLSGMRIPAEYAVSVERQWMGKIFPSPPEPADAEGEF